MQSAAGLLHDSLIAFFENKDIESVLSVFSDDIHCYGFADDSVVRGIGQLRELLDRTSMENITSYQLTFYETEELSNTARESLGVLVFSLSSNNMSVKYRVSATAQSISGTGRLTMLHFSVVNPFHKAGMFADAVQDRIGKELLETATAGGMMGGYMEEGFPFYYINQKMLDYLGYENEAMFVEDNQGLVSNCMHPEDRVRVKQQTYRQIEETGEYQVEYRMRKRNGSYIWVHDIGRALTLENGRKVILSVCYDITSDKEHSRLIENLVDTMNGGIVLYKVDSDWKLSPIYISAGVGGITNRSNNEYVELCEEDVLDSVYQEDRKLVRQAYRDADLKDKITSLTYRVPDKNGGYLWLNGMFSLFGEQDGFPVLRAVFTPATIQYDLQLQALNQGATGIVVLDADTSEVYYANETSFLLHSTERQDYIGKKCHEVFDKKGRRCTHCWRENITQEQESIDCTMVVHGKIFSVHAERRDWNGRQVFVEYLQDVTQQRQLQEKIQASNGELEAILQNVDCGFCVCRIGEDHTVDVRYLSDSYCRLFEGSEEELRTAYAHDPRYGAHPNDLPKVQEFMQRIFSTYQPGEITCRCRTAKGNWKWVTLKFTFVHEPSLGLLVYITCIDVSEQMRIQEQLRLDEEMNEAACHFAGLWTWSYNIDTGDAYLSKKMQKDFGMPARLQHYPESFLDYLLVFPEYESLYLEKIAQIREGAKEVEMAVQARFPDGPAHWIRIKINVLASSETDPAIRIAIGSALSIDQEKSLESRIKLEHQKTAAYDPALLRYTVTNITSDLVVEHKILQGGTSNKKEIHTL
jgi:PAS domain S-box-containing protein